MGDGVTDGIRTRDSQNHNLELYQLSYGHQPEGTLSAVPRTVKPRLPASVA